MPDTKNKDQIIPFPLPGYLASFFSNLITSNPIITNDGSKVKPYVVNRDSNFGTFILRQLSKAKRPPIKEGDCFYIKVLEYQTHEDKYTEDVRSSLLEFSDETINEITKIFKSFFESILIEHVTAYKDGVHSQNPNKKRGLIHPAIINFCTKYGVIFSDTNISTWKKLIQRNENKPKPFIMRCL